MSSPHSSRLPASYEVNRYGGLQWPPQFLDETIYLCPFGGSGRKRMDVARPDEERNE